MGSVCNSHPGGRRIEVQNILKHIRRDLFGNIHSQTMSSDQIAAVHRKRRKHVLGIFRGHISESTHTAMVFKLIPVSETLFRNNVQNHFIELQAVIVALVLLVPFLADRTKDSGAIFFPELPDCGQLVETGIDVRNIKDTLHIERIVRIDGIDSFAALANPEIAFVPLPHGRTGRGIRTLGCNHQRTGNIVLIKGRNHPHKLHPAFRGGTGFFKHLMCHTLQLNGAYSHDCSPQLSSEYCWDILTCQCNQAAHCQRRSIGNL